MIELFLWRQHAFIPISALHGSFIYSIILSGDLNNRNRIPSLTDGRCTFKGCPFELPTNEINNRKGQLKTQHHFLTQHNRYGLVPLYACYCGCDGFFWNSNARQNHIKSTGAAGRPHSKCYKILVKLQARITNGDPLLLTKEALNELKYMN